jgi:putative membrane protein insertion efficiency factor
MKLGKTICIIFLLISGIGFATAQDMDPMPDLKVMMDLPEKHSHYLNYVRDAENPVEFIFAILFVSYKQFFSSQDMGTCVFTPSCSAYGMQSIRKKGLVGGLLNTFDRLTRCHPFAGKNYDYDPKSYKLYDPVD